MSALPDRDTLIKERQKNSILWWTIHQLGSLKLAMLLLLTIAIACAVATFAESTFNTKVAHAYIYRAPWFKLWLVVLCVNLFAVTLTRWPWQKKHTGFIVTHYGIIILLIGALIGRIWGFEGNVVLDKDRPLGRIVSNRTILQIDSPRDNATYITDIDIAVKAPTPEKPKLMPIPGSRDKILLTDYTENMQERPVIEEAAGNPAAAPGVNLKLQSMMMGGQEIRVPLWLNDQGGLESYNLSGLASIRFMDKLPPATKEQILAPGQGVPFSETQIVFARSPESSVIDNSWGRPAGYMLVFEADESPGAGRLRVTTPAGEESIHTLPRKLPGKFKLADGTELTVAQSWTDFAIINGRPANDGKDNQNPAVMIHLIGRIQPGPTASRTLPTPELWLAPAPEPGKLRYQLRRGPFVTGSGEFTDAAPLVPGWADWTITLESFFPEAIPVGKNFILTEQEALTQDPKTLTPALRAQIQAHDGRKGEPVWIPSGQVLNLAGPDGTPQRVGFGLQAHQVPFLITLKDFEVPRRQGTQEPADFIAQVRFDHLKTGESSVQTSKMNHPASYPNEWWRPIIGLTYKFSQAQWDPNNLDQTTMQVLYDPGWFFKWVGSLAICAGIFIMFYFKPYAKKQAPAGRPETNLSTQSTSPNHTAP